MLRSWPRPIDISWPAEFSQKISNLSWHTQEAAIMHSASSHSLHVICMLLVNPNTIYIHSSSFSLKVLYCLPVFWASWHSDYSILQADRWSTFTKMVETCSESSTVAADNRRTEGSMNIKQTDEQYTTSMSNNDTEQKTIK